MGTDDANLQTVLDDLEVLVGRLFDFLELVRQELYARLDEASAAGEAPTLETISGLARVLQGRLALEGTLVAGAGISFAPDVLADSPRHMEWWTRPREEAASQPLPVTFDPQSLSFYDYVEAEWFVCARDRDDACVTGPYVDAFGTDEDVITLSLSCEHGGAFVGVCSLDLRAGELGARVTRALRELDRRAALVNAEGRVIASTVVAHLPGSLLRDLDPARRRGPRTGWSVLALD
jgi:hypothetical protein